MLWPGYVFASCPSEFRNDYGCIYFCVLRYFFQIVVQLLVGDRSWWGFLLDEPARFWKKWNCNRLSVLLCCQSDEVAVDMLRLDLHQVTVSNAEVALKKEEVTSVCKGRI